MLEQHTKPGATHRTKSQLCHQRLPGSSTFSFLGLLLVTKNDKNVPDANGTKLSPNVECDPFREERHTLAKSVPLLVFLLFSFFNFRFSSAIFQTFSEVNLKMQRGLEA